MTEKEDLKTSDENSEKETENHNDNDSKSATVGEVKSIVREAIDEVKGLFTSDDDTGDSSAEPKEGESESRQKARRSFSALEHEAEQQLKSAITGVLEEREHQKEHEELKQKKQEPQTAPIKVRWATRLMLGKNYGKE